ncbi:MAG: CHASE2 domain-containing protein [Candidatus Omnitrophica bacterium]|nr:CHASE2 domain-containing protein [Candidatus Omnitrophota bacterium]
MQKKNLKKLIVGWTITFLLSIIFLLLCPTKTYQILELKALDLRFTLSPRNKPKTPLIHIDIDDVSLAKLGRWPWPRRYHADLVNILTECGAKQIIMDILFTETLSEKIQDDELFKEAISNSEKTYLAFYFAERQTQSFKELEMLLKNDITMSLEEAASSLKVSPRVLEEKFLATKHYLMDKAIEEAVFEKPNISLEELLTSLEEEKNWYLFAEEESYVRENIQSYKLALSFIKKFAKKYSSDSWPYTKRYDRLVPPIEKYANVLAGSGFVNADADLDGVMRRVPLFVKQQESILPQLSISALMDLLAVEKVDFKPDRVVLKKASLDSGIKDIAIPVDSQGCMLVNWSGRWGDCFKHLPYASIIQLNDIRARLSSYIAGEKEKSGLNQSEINYLKNSELKLKEKLTGMVKDKVCIVGLTATGTQDLAPIPLQTGYPMVGTHSNLINTILTEKFLFKAPFFLNTAVFFLTALIIGLCALLGLWRSLILSIFYAGGYFLSILLAFAKLGLWVDLVGPLGIVIFGFSGIIGFRYFTEEREKLWIKQAFSFYLSQEVINELINDPSKLKLGGQKRSLSILFADVRGFTSFSESHQPEEVVAMLNEILDNLVNVVFKYNGTLDKFVGDELMAFWGAPSELHIRNHAVMAVRTAIEMQEELKKLQVKWIEEGKTPLQIGIGINSGDVVVGNMGSSKRMDYTVIGDNVNLAARLCSAAAKNEIIISNSTYEQVKDEVKVEKLEPISVKGKTEPISIYKAVGLE